MLARKCFKIARNRQKFLKGGISPNKCLCPRMSTDSVSPVCGILFSYHSCSRSLVVCWSVGRSVGWLVGWLVGWSVVRSVCACEVFLKECSLECQMVIKLIYFTTNVIVVTVVKVMTVATVVTVVTLVPNKLVHQKK